MDFYEIKRLNKLLAKAGIPFEFHSMYDGYQIIYPRDGKERVCDVVIHSGSYGHNYGQLEMMGLVNEKRCLGAVEGWLDSDVCFERIKKHWEKCPVSKSTGAK